MKLLIVKTSSFGDILHLFPALTDARRLVDDLICDWVVEAPYTAMPAWHPAVRNVIPVAMRRWRRPPWIGHVPAMRRFVRQLRGEKYDLVLDAQGLLKSAVLARLSRGRRAGFDGASAREPLAACCYQHKVAVGKDLHAVDRNRALLAGALGYEVPADLDYGLTLPGDHGEPSGNPPYLSFVPGTTWPSKRWPLRYWRLLTELAVEEGWRVVIPAGTAGELEAARSIGRGLERVEPRSSLSIGELAGLLAGARAAVSVDCGPGHLAAAVGTPGVSLYGATDPERTGTRGPDQVHLRADYSCAPCLRRRCRFADTGQVHPDCYATVPPARVWSTLRELMNARKGSS